MLYDGTMDYGTDHEEDQDVLEERKAQLEKRLEILKKKSDDAAIDAAIAAGADAESEKLEAEAVAKVSEDSAEDYVDADKKKEKDEDDHPSDVSDDEWDDWGWGGIDSGF